MHVKQMSPGILNATAFPTNPYDGMFKYRTDLDHLFRYDSGRSKWLGELESDGGGWEAFAAGSTGVYLYRFYNQQMSSTAGISVPYDVTIVGFSYTMPTSPDGTYYVRRNGVNISSVTAGSTVGYDMTLDDDFSSDGILSIYWESSTGATMDAVQARVYWRRRST